MFSLINNKGLVCAVITLLMVLVIPLYSYSQDRSNSLFEDEFSEFVSRENTRGWKDTVVSFVYFYEGSDIPPAEMLFFSNGVLVLESRFYSEGYKDLENRFFLYEADGHQIKITPVDNRYDVDRFVSTALYHIEKGRRGIISVDSDKKSVVFSFDDEINFLGLIFFKE